MPQQPVQIVCGSCLSRVPQSAAQCPYCGHSFDNTNPAGTLPINTLLDGRYTVGEVLGLDGEGVTYAGVDNQLTRRVFIREYLPAAISSARTTAGAIIPRPEREVLFKTTRMDFVDMYRSLMALGGQSGLAEVYDLFEANNTAYAVREPDYGNSLLEYLQLRQQPITITDALEILSPVIRGVEAMHKRGLLHRGISPETIYMSQEGKAKLSGYATQGLRTADSEIKSQIFDGYSAPEQYLAAEFDGQYTDVYALGAVLYRMLTGKAPASAWLRGKTDTLPAPRSIQGGIPAHVSAAIVRAMRLEPDERIQSMSELFETVTEPSSHSAGFHFTNRQKIYIGAAAGGLLLIIIICILAFTLGTKKASSSSSSSSSEVSSVAASSSSKQNTGVVNPLSGITQSSSSSSSSSSSKQTYEVPNFIGMLYTDIQKNVDYQKVYVFTTVEAFSDTVPSGSISAQTVAAGTKVEADTVITLTISKGPEAAKMPVVVGFTQSEAEAYLKLAGIKYSVVQMENDGKYQEGTVVKTDTPEGTAVDVTKTTVVIYVAKAPVYSSSSNSQITPTA